MDFENLLQDCINSLEKSIQNEVDYRYSDEGITEDLENTLKTVWNLLTHNYLFMNEIEFTLFYLNYVGTNKVDPTIIEHYYNLCKDSGMCYADFLHSIRLQKTDLKFTTKEDLYSNLGIKLEHDVLYFQIDMFSEAILYIELTNNGFWVFNGEKDVRCSTLDEAVQILNIFHLTNS